jgi:hypothetical protein
MERKWIAAAHRRRGHPTSCVPTCRHVRVSITYSTMRQAAQSHYPRLCVERALETDLAILHSFSFRLRLASHHFIPMITDMIATAKRVIGRGHLLCECWSSGIVGGITSTSSVVHREGPVCVSVANSINSRVIEDKVVDDVGNKPYGKHSTKQTATNPGPDSPKN